MIETNLDLTPELGASHSPDSMSNSGFILWFTGLSGSGKSTLANYLTPILKEKGCKIEFGRRKTEGKIDSGGKRLLRFPPFHFGLKA